MLGELIGQAAQAAQVIGLAGGCAEYGEQFGLTEQAVAAIQLARRYTDDVEFSCEDAGRTPIDDLCWIVERAIAAGATEIDCVLPYQQLMAGDEQGVAQFLAAVRQATPNICLKIIIESGELVTPQQIIKATELAIECGSTCVRVGSALFGARSYNT